MLGKASIAEAFTKGARIIRVSCKLSFFLALKRMFRR